MSSSSSETSSLSSDVTVTGTGGNTTISSATSSTYNTSSGRNGESGTSESASKEQAQRRSGSVSGNVVSSESDSGAVSVRGGLGKAPLRLNNVPDSLGSGVPFNLGNVLGTVGRVAGGVNKDYFDITGVLNLVKSSVVKTHISGLRVHRRTFTGKEFVDVVTHANGIRREDAVRLGQLLLDYHYFHHVSLDPVFRDEGHMFYRLLEDWNSKALNAGFCAESIPQTANQLGENLRKMILKMYGRFLSGDGKEVDYAGMRHSKEFREYTKTTKRLQRVLIVDATRDEKLAFFINIYNALCIHGNIVRGPPTNLWKRYRFFNTVKYIIGGYEYSLQDIENGVLRANRKGVGMLCPPFSASKGDPRLKVALNRHEPLIHFALVCGAKSCPPISCYKPEKVMDQLRLAAETFLSGTDACNVDMTTRTVYLSRILKWYRADFGENDEEVALWVHGTMSASEMKTLLGELLDSKNFKVKYMKYDWSVNSSAGSAI